MSPLTVSKLSAATERLRRVVITGATGCIGRAVTSELSARGAKVTALVRDATSARHLEGFADLDLIEGDLSSVSSLRAAMREADAVFHAAAYVHNVPKSVADRTALHQVNVEGTRALVELARDSAAKAFVLFSTISVYGRDHQAPLSEQTPTHPETDYGRSKLQAEEVLFSLLRGSQTRATALRYCMVYGKGDRGNLKRLIRSVQRGRYLDVDGGRARKNLLHARDAACAAILAAGADLSDQQIFVVSDPTAYSMREIATAIAKALNKKPPRGSLPSPLLRAGAKMVESLRPLGFKPPFTAADVQTLTRDVICDPTKIRQTLGFEPMVNLEQGLAECITWYSARD